MRYWTICALQLLCVPVCEVINFEITLGFLIKPFSYMTKKVRAKFKYVNNKKGIYSKIKAFFIIFKGLSFTQIHSTRRWQSNFKPFLDNVPILDPLKTLENSQFSGVFMGYKMRTQARNGKSITTWPSLFTNSS